MSRAEEINLSRGCLVWLSLLKEPTDLKRSGWRDPERRKEGKASLNGQVVSQGSGSANFSPFAQNVHG